jgi:AraC-like DNA-binding protein
VHRRSLALDGSRSTARLTGGMSRDAEIANRHLLRARDEMDRAYTDELDIAALARIAHVSPAHFIRRFKATFGETPHRYLQRRRIERAMYLLRTSDRKVSDICMEVGFTSLGTFGRTFREIVGETPLEHRNRGPIGDVPSCFVKAWTRPSSAMPNRGPSSRSSSSFGEAGDPAEPLP